MVNLITDLSIRKNYSSTVYVETFATKLGEIIICATDRGICLLEFEDKKKLEKEFNDIQKKFHAAIIPGTNSHIDLAKSEINMYILGKLKKFTVSLDIVGTDFQKNVWKILMKIPYGSTYSYKEQAALLGNTKAVRAVANANGMNKIALIIPCHRVIGSNGLLTGYAGGVTRKKWLLELESKNK